MLCMEKQEQICLEYPPLNRKGKGGEDWSNLKCGKKKIRKFANDNMKYIYTISLVDRLDPDF